MKTKNTTWLVSASILLINALIVIPSHATSLTRNDIKRIVLEEAMNSIVPPALALAVAKVESDFNPNALSSAGARGVMQILPQTARQEFGISADELWDTRLNIQLGVDYLAQLYRQYGRRWNLALSHYNGGSLRGQGLHATPHPYTRKYVQVVQRWRQRYQDQSIVWNSGQGNHDLHLKEQFESARTKVKTALRQSLKNYRKAKVKNSAKKTSAKLGSVLTPGWMPWGNSHL